MPATATDDLSTHASTTTVDFYALLSLSPTASDSDIRSAFRRTTLKYHPDKVGDTPENVDKFLLVKVAYDVLSDARVRALYDQSREARIRREVERERLEGGRRRMVSELERREGEVVASRKNNDGGVGFMGVKRSRSGERESAEQKLQREIARIAGENRRKKEELVNTRERDRLEEEEYRADQEEAAERLRLRRLRATEKSRRSENAPGDAVGKASRVPPKDPHPQPSTTTTTATATASRDPSKFEQSVLEKLKAAQRDKEVRKQSAAAVGQSLDNGPT